MSQADEDEPLPTTYEWSKAWRLRNTPQRNEERTRNYAQSRTEESQRKRPWTPEEDAEILAHVEIDRVMAARLDRTVQAIQQRRFKLTRYRVRNVERKYTTEEVVSLLADLNTQVAAATGRAEFHRVVAELVRAKVDALEAARWSRGDD